MLSPAGNDSRVAYRLLAPLRDAFRLLLRLLSIVRTEVGCQAPAESKKIAGREFGGAYLFNLWIHTKMLDRRHENNLLRKSSGDSRIWIEEMNEEGGGGLGGEVGGLWG